VLNEARILIGRRVKELQSKSSITSLFDIVEVTTCIVNDLVSRYQNTVEESFGYALSGLDNLNSGNAKLFTVFGAGLSEVPWACLGSGSSYARPLVEFLLADGKLPTHYRAVERAVEVALKRFLDDLENRVRARVINNKEQVSQL
jgi:hypothetical protein